MGRGCWGAGLINFSPPRTVAVTNTGGSTANTTVVVNSSGSFSSFHLSNSGRVSSLEVARIALIYYDSFMRDILIPVDRFSYLITSIHAFEKDSRKI